MLADELKFLSENDICYSKMCFVLITVLNVIIVVIQFQTLDLFQSILSDSRFFGVFLISLLDLHDRLYLLLVFNLNDLSKIPLSNRFHKCCTPARFSAVFFY